tara:strand:+ start:1515 stop:1697 length:183 start_codon:yes stop_codon:yes gene_type:complete
MGNDRNYYRGCGIRITCSESDEKMKFGGKGNGKRLSRKVNTAFRKARLTRIDFKRAGFKF